MNPKDFASQPRRVGGAGKVDILKCQHLDSDYESINHSDRLATLMGLVTLVEIKPKEIKSLPAFILRWDSKVDTVDADIYLYGKHRNKLWEQPGYEGHHSMRISGLSRRFEINIEIPGRRVFKGIVDVGLLIDINQKIEIEISNTGQISIISDNLKPQIGTFLLSKKHRE